MDANDRQPVGDERSPVVTAVGQFGGLVDSLRSEVGSLREELAVFRAAVINHRCEMAELRAEVADMLATMRQARPLPRRESGGGG